MKKSLIVMALLITLPTYGAEVAHGQWSDKSQIIEIRSFWSFTDYKINGTDGCGSAGDGWWRLNNQSSNDTIASALEYKKSMLLASFMAGKKVQLRCEHTAISDFIVEG